MKVSTRVEYGVLALIDIALNSENKSSVSAVDISQRQGISKKYLEQILPLLKQAGLIKAQKGLGGGYYLSCSADDVSVADILNALDNSILEEMEYTSGKGTQELGGEVNAILWKEMNGKLSEFANYNSLSDLIRKCREKISDGWDMYVI